MHCISMLYLWWIKIVIFTMQNKAVFVSAEEISLFIFSSCFFIRSGSQHLKSCVIMVSNDIYLVIILKLMKVIHLLFLTFYFDGV